jgi:hypothetical protein
MAAGRRPDLLLCYSRRTSARCRPIAVGVGGSPGVGVSHLLWPTDPSTCLLARGERAPPGCGAVACGHLGSARRRLLLRPVLTAVASWLSGRGHVVCTSVIRDLRALHVLLRKRTVDLDAGNSFPKKTFMQGTNGAHPFISLGGAMQCCGCITWRRKRDPAGWDLGPASATEMLFFPT